MANLDDFELAPEHEWLRARLADREPEPILDGIRLEPPKRAVALKRVRADEPFFHGHFPGMPIMPGVFLVQSMAQAAVVLALAGAGPDDDRWIRLAGVKKARFRKMVEPGNELQIDVELSQLSESRWRFQARTTCDGAPVAEVTGLLAVDD